MQLRKIQAKTNRIKYILIYRNEVVKKKRKQKKEIPKQKGIQMKTLPTSGIFIISIISISSTANNFTTIL